MKKLSNKERKTNEELYNVVSLFMKFSADDTKNDFSVIETAFKELNTQQHNPYTGAYGDIINSNDIKAVRALDTNKCSRLQYYYNMSQYQEVSDALDELCESALNYDETGRILNITYDNKFPEKLKKVFNEEFENMISPLNFEQNMFKYLREFLITGELCFENVIDPKDPKQGIINYAKIPTHSYEYAIDTTNNKKVGIIVRVNTLRNIDTDVNGYNGTSGISSDKFKQNFKNKNGINLDNLKNANDILNGKMIFLPFSQLLYCHADSMSPDETIIYPLLSKVKRAYNQLISIEDSIIIYTVSRAPIRFSFNVGMGNVNANKQRETLNQYMRKYNNTMTYDTSTGAVQSKRDSHLMIESFWFAKPLNTEGTTVDQLGGDASFGELDSLKYFQDKLRQAFKIPRARTNEETSIWTKESDSITFDEYRFAQLIIRITNRIALGLKYSFITHLQLTEQWNEISKKINESSFNIEFIKPIAFNIYQQKITLTNKMEMFERATSTDFIDPVIAMKKYLGMTDEEIEENFVSMEKTKTRLAKIQYKVTNFEEYGTEKPPVEEPTDDF